jgi:transposase
VEKSEFHYYSVPYRLIGEKLDVRVTANVVEILRNGARVASHARSWVKHKHTTLKEHMPEEHQRYAEWTPTRIIEWAAKTGPWTAMVVERMLKTRQHPEQAYRSALGIFRLADRAGIGVERLENACRRAVEYGSCSYRSVRSILEKGMDRYEEPKQTDQPLLPLHDNIRGSGYYH